MKAGAGRLLIETLTTTTPARYRYGVKTILGWVAVLALSIGWFLLLVP